MEQMGKERIEVDEVVRPVPIEIEPIGQQGIRINQVSPERIPVDR